MVARQAHFVPALLFLKTFSSKNKKSETELRSFFIFINGLKNGKFNARFYAELTYTSNPFLKMPLVW